MTDRKQSRREYLVRVISGTAGSIVPTSGLQRLFGLFAGTVYPLLARSSGLGSTGGEINKPAGTTKPGSRRICGVLVDAARLPESYHYYERLIDFYQEWGLNTLLVRVTDDEGSALRFSSHPELITHKNALTPEDAHRLAGYARQRGVDLIPVIESFGHSEYITKVPQYAHLADHDPKQNATGLIPVDPQTLRLIGDLYREAASIFPSRYIHGGCDEVGWGGAEQSREALRIKSRAQIWADHLNSLNEICRGLGKELIVWGDHVLRKEPDILDLLSKDVIVMDWDYRTTDPVYIERMARKALESGFRVIGAPAITWCRWGPRVGAVQLRNIDAYADAYHKIVAPRCLGVIVNNGVASRYIQDSIWDSIAYAATAITKSSKVAREVAFKSFVKRFYGAKWNENWANVYQTFYDIAPHQRVCGGSLAGCVLPAPWSNEEQLKAIIQAGSTEAPPVAGLLRSIDVCEGFVRKNSADFAAFKLSAEYLEHLFWRNTSVVIEARNAMRTRESAAALVQTIAERDLRLLQILETDWDKGRPSDSPIKFEAITSNPPDQLLFRFREATSYSRRLAANPDSFGQLLALLHAKRREPYKSIA